MSFLHKPSSTSISPIYSQVGLTWGEFVQLVLSLTIQAYGLMKQSCAVQLNWQENVFTLNLEEYLGPLAYDHSIFVQTRGKQHTPAMRAGIQSTNEAKEMDISLFGSWDRAYRDVRFVWEAKRVGDKRTNVNYGKLNTEYVHEAIYRFIGNEYAASVPDAGILAYVLAGDVVNIVADINQSMGNIHKNPALDASNHLQITEPIEDFQDRYYSQHARTNNTPIQLHHLFLTFEFT